MRVSCLTLLVLLLAAPLAGCYTISNEDVHDWNGITGAIPSPAASAPGTLRATIDRAHVANAPADDNVTAAFASLDKSVEGLNMQVVKGKPYGSGDIKAIGNNIAGVQAKAAGVLAIVKESSAYQLKPEDELFLNRIVLLDMTTDCTNINGRISAWSNDVEFIKEIAELILKDAIRVAEAYYTGGAVSPMARAKKAALPATFEDVRSLAKGHGGRSGLLATPSDAAQAVARWKEWCTFLAGALDAVADGKVADALKDAESLAASLKKQPAAGGKYDVIIETASDVILVIAKALVHNNSQASTAELSKALHDVASIVRDIGNDL